MKAKLTEQRIQWGLTISFLLLGVLFVLNLWGKTASLQEIPLVDKQFTTPGTVRQSATDIYAADGDTSVFECYLCHDEDKTPELEFDDNGKIIIPEDHQDLGEMRHGEHDRNNNCFNCHKQDQLDALQTRDDRTLTIQDSSRLCGSCHGPTYRDWEAGVHGRTYGYWDESLGERNRIQCASCHNPHHPAFPPIKPAPAPHRLHPEINAENTPDA